MSSLADTILLVHFLFVLFVVGGLVLIWIGAALNWRWVRNFWFRIAHLFAILFVAAEAIIGVACPLTVWEDALRPAAAGGGSFIQRWVHRILFYDLPDWFFTLLHVGFALIVALTFYMVRPDKPAGRRNP